MKKGLTVIVIIAAIVIELFFWVKNSYNGLVKSDEQVKAV